MTVGRAATTPDPKPSTTPDSVFDAQHFHTHQPGYILHGEKGTSGLWVQPGHNKPFASVYADANNKVAVIGVAKDQSGDGMDFAIVALPTGVHFQIRDEKGKFHFVPVAELIKLAGPEKPGQQLGWVAPVR